MTQTAVKDPRKQEVLESYKADLERWKERGGRYRDNQPLTVNEVLFFRSAVHPTKKRESREVTKTLIEYLLTHEITTAKEIYADTGLSDKPVLTRLKIFVQFGLVRRESKKYYLATPRLEELKRRYMRRILE